MMQRFNCNVMMMFVIQVLVVSQFLIWFYPLSLSWIHPIPSAIFHTLTRHIIYSGHPSSLKNLYFLFHMLFPGLLWSSPLSLATLKTLSSFLLSTCFHHQTPFAFTSLSTVSFHPSMPICSLVGSLSASVQPHMALTIALSIFLEIGFLCSFKHLFWLPYSTGDLVQQW